MFISHCKAPFIGFKFLPAKDREWETEKINKFSQIFCKICLTIVCLNFGSSTHLLQRLSDHILQLSFHTLKGRYRP